METLEQQLARAGRELGFDGRAEPTQCRCGAELEHGTICERCAAADRNENRVQHALRDVGAVFRKMRFDGKGDDNVATRVSARALHRARSLTTLSRVVLFGETGVGKTSLVCAMVRDRIQRTGEVARVIPCRELSICRARFETSDASLESKAIGADLLVLDDLGNGQGVPSSPIKDIIAKRHAEGLATWTTTFLDYAGLAAVIGGDHARRIYERAAIIDCNPGEAT